MYNFSRRYLFKLVSGILLSATSYNVAARSFKLPKNVIIMLDPGHGGKDPGAIGPRGTKEKDIVLDIAKKTQYFLKEKYNLNSLLTRKDDVFIDLNKRVTLAHEYHCTLFVSIHADGFSNPSVCGSSVFSLSLNGATTSLEKYIEKTENNSKNNYSELIFSKNKELNRVLLDLSQQTTLRKSEIFSKCMINSLGMKHHMHNHYCNHANFVVLRSPIIPSILVETAFITNSNDEEALNKSHYRSRVAYDIANGISAFIKCDAI